MKRVGMMLAAAAVLVGCASKRVVTAPAAAARIPAPKAAEQRSASDSELLAAILRGAVLRFEFDSAELTSSSRAQLQQVADALRERPWATARVSGHCDERGTVEYNLALGHRRAEAAKSYLVALGVHPDAVETVSFGAETPAEEGHSEDAWAANRRDELAPVDPELLGRAD